MEDDLQLTIYKFVYFPRIHQMYRWCTTEYIRVII